MGFEDDFMDDEHDFLMDEEGEFDMEGDKGAKKTGKLYKLTDLSGKNKSRSHAPNQFKMSKLMPR